MSKQYELWSVTAILSNLSVSNTVGDLNNLSKAKIKDNTDSNLSNSQLNDNRDLTIGEDEKELQKEISEGKMHKV